MYRQAGLNDQGQPLYVLVQGQAQDNAGQPLPAQVAPQQPAAPAQDIQLGYQQNQPPIPIRQFQQVQPMQPLPEPRTYIERVRMIQQSTRDAARLPPTNRPKAWDNVAQIPVTPIPQQGFIERGPADNRLVFGQLAAGACNLMPCILRNLNIYPFLQDDIDDNLINFDGFLVAGQICALRIESVVQRREQLILEMIAPWIPDDQVLDQDASVAEVGRIIGNAQRLRGEIWFGEGVRQLQQAHPINAQHPPVIGQDGNPQNLDHISHIWNAVAGEWIDNVTIQQILELLVEIVRVMNVRDRNRGLYPIVLMMIAMSVQGQITPAKLAKIIADLSNDFQGVVESLNQPEVAATWRNFGQYINDGNVAGVIRRWINQIPQGSIRLRVVLAQAAGSGLTQLDTIVRARNEHPDFPWVNLVRFYRNEWEAAARAMQAVGNNPYFGFRRDLREVRSTQYRSLAWACAQILIHGGDRALDNYRGFIEDRAHRDAVMDLIRGYYALQNQPDLDRIVSREEYEFIEDTVGLVREYAGGMAGRADMLGHNDMQGHDNINRRPGNRGDRGGRGGGQGIGGNVIGVNQPQVGQGHQDGRQGQQHVRGPLAPIVINRRQQQAQAGQNIAGAAGVAMAGPAQAAQAVQAQAGQGAGAAVQAVGIGAAQVPVQIPIVAQAAAVPVQAVQQPAVGVQPGAQGVGPAIPPRAGVQLDGQGGAGGGGAGVQG